MSLSEELAWRGFINQTTLSDVKELDSKKFSFYWGVDPSADSMTVGHLAMAMMVKHFIDYGHQAWLLVGGATGLIGDPDGKSEERKLLSREVLNNNKKAIAKQYKQLFSNKMIRIVDNYDWFKDYKFIDFLRDVGKRVPMRQMLSREFVQSRLDESGNGISYAEFSYVLIQAYDFLNLYQNHGVTMQVCGSDQWGNSVAGVDLIRRVTGGRAEVWSGPLIINPKTGIKYGKTESGAVWLDPKKTSTMSFYQFWVNADDEVVEHYLKIFTLLSREEINEVINKHKANPQLRIAQSQLAYSVTEFVHGKEAALRAKRLSEILVGKLSLAQAQVSDILALKNELNVTKSKINGSIVTALVSSGLASSNTEARQLLSGGSIYINHMKVKRDNFIKEDFTKNSLILRRGKAYKDSVLVEL